MSFGQLITAIRSAKNVETFIEYHVQNETLKEGHEYDHIWAALYRESKSATPYDDWRTMMRNTYTRD